MKQNIIEILLLFTKHLKMDIFDIVKYLIDIRIQLCDEKWRSKIAVEKQKFNTVSHELVVYNLQLQHPYHIFIFISTKKRFLTPTIHNLTQTQNTITSLSLSANKLAKNWQSVWRNWEKVETSCIYHAICWTDAWILTSQEKRFLCNDRRA